MALAWYSVAQIAQPSWVNGFARRAGESVAPEQWANLVACWVPALGQTGVFVYDMSGVGASGELLGNTAWTRNAQGSALTFDGGSSSFQVFHTPIHNPPQISVAAWVQLAVSQQDWGKIITKGNDLAYTLSCKRSNVDQPDFRIWIGGTEFHAQGTTNINDNQRHCLVGTYDGAAVRIFVDGVQQASVAASGAIATSTDTMFWMGAGNNVAGLIEQVRLYSRGLSPAEVRTMSSNPLALLQRARPHTWPVSITLAAPTGIKGPLVGGRLLQRGRLVG